MKYFLLDVKQTTINQSESYDVNKKKVFSNCRLVPHINKKYWQHQLI